MSKPLRWALAWSLLAVGLGAQPTWAAPEFLGQSIKAVRDSLVAQGHREQPFPQGARHSAFENSFLRHDLWWAEDQQVALVVREYPIGQLHAKGGAVWNHLLGQRGMLRMNSPDQAFRLRLSFQHGPQAHQAWLFATTYDHLLVFADAEATPSHDTVARDHMLALGQAWLARYAAAADKGLWLAQLGL